MKINANDLWYSRNGGVGHVVLKVADITAAGARIREVDVARLSPARTPRVADEPVSGTDISVVANSLDAVVNRTRARGQDTRGVVLPRLSSNADRDWANAVQHVCELTADRTGVATVISDSVDSLAVGQLAVAGFGNVVGVGSVSLETEALFNAGDVSIMRPATIASIVRVSASSALLNTQHLEVARLDSIEGLNSLISTEGPAGTAVSLVLHSGDNTLCSPVNNSVGGRDVRFNVYTWSAVRKTLHEAGASELFRREISKGVDAKDSLSTLTNVFSVHLSNANKVRLEGHETTVQFLKGVITLFIFDKEVIEQVPRRLVFVLFDQMT
jgi:hypothetical protein